MIDEQVKGLKDLGYRVKTYHVRYFDNVDQYIDDRGNRLVDGLMTKSEFEKALEADEVRFFGWPSPEERAYGKQVSPKGGFTVVEILDGDGKLLSRGKMSFKNRAYAKKVGRQAAFGRALSRLKGVKE
jgi:hypothetical protein